MACRHRDINMRLMTPLLLLLLVASLATVSRSASVGEYPANQRCGVTSVEEKCDPAETAANTACSAACHCSGCGGGHCVYLGSGNARGCHCLP